MARRDWQASPGSAEVVSLLGVQCAFCLQASCSRFPEAHACCGSSDERQTPPHAPSASPKQTSSWRIRCRHLQTSGNILLEPVPQPGWESGEQTEHVPFSMRRRERSHVLKKKTVRGGNPLPVSSCLYPVFVPPRLTTIALETTVLCGSWWSFLMLNQTFPGCCSSWLARSLHWVASPAAPSITPGVGFIFRTTRVAGDALTCLELIFWYLTGRIYTRQHGLKAPCMWKIMQIASHDPKPWFW